MSIDRLTPTTNGHNGDLPTINHQQFQQLQGEVLRLITNEFLLTRDALNKALFDPRRDVSHECGYQKNPTLEAFLEMYERSPYAKTVVELYPQECWQVQPLVYEEEEADTVTPFEEAWDGLGRQLRGEASWYGEEADNPVWSYLQRLDKVSGLGRYGALLIGIDDGLALDQPAEGIDDLGYGKDGPPKPEQGEDQGQRDRVEAGSSGYMPLFAGVGTDRQYWDYTGYAPDAGPQNGQDGRQGGDQKANSKRRKVNFLRVFPEHLAQIINFEYRNCPRYGQPYYYQVTFNDPRNQTGSGAMMQSTKVVHWSRILHVADTHFTSPYNEWFARPRQLVVFNALWDMLKVTGAASEGFWQAAFSILSFETHPQLGTDVQLPANLKDEAEKLMMSLKRWTASTGGTWKAIAPTVSDPTGHAQLLIEHICNALRCPVRIFKGSERGELASSQDDAAWNDRVKERCKNYVTPKIIIPFVDRLIAMGVLPEPAKPKQVPKKDPKVKLSAPQGGGAGGPPGGKLGGPPQGAGGKPGGAPAFGAKPKPAGPNFSANAFPPQFKKGKPAALEADDEEQATGAVPAQALGEPQASQRQVEGADAGRRVGPQGSAAAGQEVPDAAPGEPGVAELSHGSGGLDEQGNELDASGLAQDEEVDAQGKVATVGGYRVEWPDLTSMSAAEKAGVALQQTQALGAYVQGNLAQMVAPLDYLTRVMGYSEEEALAMLSDAEADALEQEAQDQQDAMETMANAPPMQPMVDEEGNPLPPDQQPPQAGQVPTGPGQGPPGAPSGGQPPPPNGGPTLGGPAQPQFGQPKLQPFGKKPPVANLDTVLNAEDEARANCGTGAGGFQPGNTCGKQEGGTGDDVKLSAKQWKSVYALPADGIIRDVEGVGKAVHFPATKIRVESVYVVLKDAEKNVAGHMEGRYLRRRNIKGYWNNAEPVGELPERPTTNADLVTHGGPGSGNFGHEGRPGEVGGSGEGDGGGDDQALKDAESKAQAASDREAQGGGKDEHGFAKKTKEGGYRIEDLYQPGYGPEEEPGAELGRELAMTAKAVAGAPVELARAYANEVKIRVVDQQIKRALRALGPDQYEDAKGIVGGIFSRVTLGMGPLAIKAVRFGIKYGPPSFRAFVSAARGLGHAAGWTARKAVKGARQFGADVTGGYSSSGTPLAPAVNAEGQVNNPAGCNQYTGPGCSGHLSDAEMFKRTGQQAENLQLALGFKRPVMGPKYAERVRNALSKHRGGRVIAALLAVDGSETSYDRNGFAERGNTVYRDAVSGKFSASELKAASDWLHETYNNSKELANVNQYRWIRGAVMTADPAPTVNVADLSLEELIANWREQDETAERPRPPDDQAAAGPQPRRPGAAPPAASTDAARGPDGGGADVAGQPAAGADAEGAGTVPAADDGAADDDAVPFGTAADELDGGQDLGAAAAPDDKRAKIERQLSLLVKAFDRLANDPEEAKEFWQVSQKVARILAASEGDVALNPEPPDDEQEGWTDEKGKPVREQDGTQGSGPQEAAVADGGPAAGQGDQVVPADAAPPQAPPQLTQQPKPKPPVANADQPGDCGIGSGGFEAGNKCGKDARAAQQPAQAQQGIAASPAPRTPQLTPAGSLKERLMRKVRYGNFCGPGNTGAGDTPVDAVDAACKEHDRVYAKCGADWRSGVVGGGQASRCTLQADRKLMDHLRKLEAAGGLNPQQAKAAETMQAYFGLHREVAAKGPVGPTVARLFRMLVRNERLVANTEDPPAGDNCGTGSGGFQPGNTCGREGAFSRAEKTVSKWKDMFDDESAGQGEVANVPLEDIVLRGQRLEEVTPLDDNRRMPVILRETEKGYEVLDGFGRINGMLNAGKETIKAILITKGDLTDLGGGWSGGDDDEWVQAVMSEYGYEAGVRGSLLNNADAPSGDNCGIAAGGFQPGNTCAKGGGKSNRPPAKELGAVKYSGRSSTNEDELSKMYYEGNWDETHHGQSEIASALSNQGADRVILRDFHAAGYPIVGAVSFSNEGGEYIIHHLGSTGAVGGTGTELVRAVLDRAVKSKAGISFESTPNAEEFYRKLGFKSDPIQSKLMSVTADEAKEMKKRLGSLGRSSPTANEEDCGTGAGGFQSGNTCAKGGGGKAPDLSQTQGKQLGQKSHVHTVEQDGKAWVVKQERGRHSDLEREVTISKMAEVAGVNVPEVHLTQYHGKPSVAMARVNGKVLAEQDFAAVPKEQVERQLAFDILVGARDRHDRNYLFDGKQLTAIDNELTFTPQGSSLSSAIRDSALARGLGMGHRPSPGILREMASKAEAVAKLAPAGVRKDILHRGKLLAEAADKGMALNQLAYHVSKERPWLTWNFDPGQERDERGRWSGSAVDALDRMPKLSRTGKPREGGDYVANPLPRSSHEDAMEVALAKEFKQAEMTGTEYAKAFATEETVPTSALESGQTIVKVDSLKHFVKSGSDAHYSDKPLVVQFGGRYIVRDGNHRLAADLLNGKDKVKVRLLYVPGG